MAVEFCSEKNPASSGVSPRISFSHDLCKYDVVPIEPNLPLNQSSPNFNFPSRQSLHSYSSADELFSNGVLLPLQDKTFKPPQRAPPPPQAAAAAAAAKSSSVSSSASSTSSFWKFKRSRSFSCSSIYRGSLCPLQILSRSKSTGSNSSSSKRSLVPKEGNNRNLVGGLNQRTCQKPPVKKTYASSTSPVLNVSSANLFGLGSLFGKTGGGDKINNKKKLVV